MRTYALIATDSRSEYARGKLKRRPLTVCLRMKLSLKYRLQVDSVARQIKETSINSMFANETLFEVPTPGR